MSTRTFKVPTEGSDVKAWQDDIRKEFAQLGIICPIVSDGKYGTHTRAYTASLCTALGLIAEEVMKDGVTPKLRIRIRNRDLTEAEEKRMADRQDYRRALRERYAAAAITGVHRPVAKIIEDSWGYYKGGHDGIDVICPPEAPIFAMVKSKVIDVRSADWWGKGAAPNPAVRAKGDGIIQLEILETVGPFKKGYHIGYGHAEHAQVVEGQIVEAGRKIGHAGLAVAWHVHLMYNTGNTEKGIGNLDPREILDYAVKYG